MKILKFLPLILVLTLYNSSSLAETKKDCSSIVADTGVKMYEKLKCKMDQDDSTGFKSKLKNLFKKKN